MFHNLGDATEVLNRRFAFLREQAGAALVVHLPSYLDLITCDTRIAPYTQELKTEADALRSEFAKHCELVATEARGLKDALPPGKLLGANLPYTLKSFDEISAQQDFMPGVVVAYRDSEDHSDAAKLIARLLANGGGPDTAELESRHQRAFRRFKLREWRCPGHAIRRLTFLTAQLNPRPIVLQAADDGEIDENTLRPYGIVPDLFRKAIWQHVEEKSMEAAHLRDALSLVAADVALVHGELCDRIGGTMSRLALVNRFKRRCEWYDASRMRELAETAEAVSRKEALFTDELARFLFDAGLEPVTEFTAGSVRLDIVESGTRGRGLYVEAKQYGLGESATSKAKQALRQVRSTAGRLRGSPYEVREAFVVMFRRGGPLFELPAVFETHDIRVHFVTVDLAPTSEAGSKEKQEPVLVTPSELQDEAV